MRVFLIASLMWLWAPATAWAQGAIFECRTPAAATSRTNVLCERLRTNLRVNSADWDGDECATEAWRQWLRDYEGESTAQDSRDTVRDDTKTALQQWDVAFPPAYDASACGDGVIDPEWGEVCDEGAQNGVPGSGCDGVCQTEGAPASATKGQRQQEELRALRRAQSKALAALRERHLREME